MRQQGLLQRALHKAGIEDFDIFLALLAGLLSLLLLLKQRRDNHIEFIRPTPAPRPSTASAVPATPAPSASNTAGHNSSSAEDSDASRPPATAPTEEEAAAAAAARKAAEGAGDSYDGNTCVVCLDNPRNVLLMPCAHMVLCRDCAVNLRDCPTCRAKIRQQVQVYS